MTAERAERMVAGRGGTRIVTLRDEIDTLRGEIEQLMQMHQTVVHSQNVRLLWSILADGAGVG